MSRSFEKINYNLRPNKCIERKMMVEALARLSHIEQLNNYRYIGFGSPYFADFNLFHKQLGIHKLVSIEKEVHQRKRFNFNIPFAGVEMHYGLSTAIIPNLELGKEKNILWLDYDDKISDFMFSDIDSFVSNASPGSFLIISLSVQEEFLQLSVADKEGKQSLKKYRMDCLKNRVGKKRIPVEYAERNLNTKATLEISTEMINRQIQTSLNSRNGLDEDPVEFQQLLNFVYQDNSTILTIGGLLHNSEQKASVDAMAFDELPFVRRGAEIFNINCPNLTYREAKALDRILPNTLETNKRTGAFIDEAVQEIPLIGADIKNYAKVYRYYPNFADSNI